MRERAIDLFWNGRSRRPRLPVRLVAVFVVLALLGLGAVVVAPLVRPSILWLLGQVFPTAQANLAAGNVVFATAQVLVFVGAVYMTGRFVDRRRFVDFGLHVDRTWWADLGFGLVLGAALMTGIFLVELVAGWVVVTDTIQITEPSFPFWPWFAWSVVTFVGIGVTEELLARGYLIKNLAEGLSWFDRLGERGAVGVASAVSALVFGVGHATNPNASPASTVGILIAALMLAAGYAVTGELAIPIGIHVTWNLFQGTVYGFPVSGLTFGLSILAIEQRGPALATGGSFGPEAGLLGVGASVVGTSLILGWASWREGRVRIPPGLTTPDLRTAMDE